MMILSPLPSPLFIITFHYSRAQLVEILGNLKEKPDVATLLMVSDRHCNLIEFLYLMHDDPIFK